LKRNVANENGVHAVKRKQHIGAKTSRGFNKTNPLAFITLHFWIQASKRKSYFQQKKKKEKGNH